MKKQIALSLLALFSFGMTACDEGTVPEPDPDPIIIIPDPIIENYENYFSLSSELSEGVTLKLETQGTVFKAGTIIRFTLEVADSVLLEDVTVNGEEVSQIEGTYVFVMPNANAVIKTTSFKKNGDYDPLSISDVDETKIPSVSGVSDATAVMTALKGIQGLLTSGKSAEVKYLKSGTVVSRETYVPLKDYGFSQAYQNQVSFEVGYNDVMLYKGDGLAEDAENSQAHYFEKGLKKDIYYTRGYSAKEYSPSTYADKTYSKVETSDDSTVLKSVISDDKAYTTDDEGNKTAKYDTAREIPNTEAKESLKSSGILDYAKDTLFGTSSTSFLYEKEGALNNKVLKLEHVLSEDKKSYTLNLVSEITPASDTATDYQQLDLTLTVDGDGFISSLKHHLYTYTKATWYDATKPMHLKDGATVKDSSGDVFFEMKAVRGYRQELTKVDIESYAMQDYDVLLNYNVDYTDDGMVANKDNEFTIIQGAHVRSFGFVNFAGAQFKPEIIQPKLTGADEADAYTMSKWSNDTSNSYCFDKIGTYHLNFDNWFGVSKKIEVKVIRPLPYSLEVTSDKDYIYTKGTDAAESKITIKAEITPDEADRAMTIKVVRHDKSADGETTTDVDVTSDMAKSVTPDQPSSEEIQDKTAKEIDDLTPDAQWEISNAKAVAGNYTATVSCDANASVYKKVDFTVYDKPSVDGLLANMTAKTFKTTHTGTDAIFSYSSYYYSGCAFYVNFTQDETQASDDYVTGSAEIMEFKRSYYSSYRYKTTAYWRITKATMNFELGGSSSDYTSSISQGKDGSYSTSNSYITGITVLADGLLQLSFKVGSSKNYANDATAQMTPIDRVSDWTSITTN